MVKVIIVDDEYLVLEHLKKVIDWTALGMSLCGEASNGEDALQLVEKTGARLAIVDINMPVLNGIEFSSIANKRFPDLKIIILTGYSSFEYIKSAMKSGVVDYLLKPINKHELTALLEKIKSGIEEEDQIKGDLEKLKTLSSEQENILKERFLHTLLEGGNWVHSPKEWQENLTKYCPTLCSEISIVAVSAADNFELSGESHECSQYISSGLKNIFDDELKLMFNYELVIDSTGNLVAIVNTSDPEAFTNTGIFRQKCEHIRNRVRNELKYSITMAISSPYDTFNKTGNAYKEAITALKCRLLYGADSIIPYEQVKPTGKPVKLKDTLRQDLLISLKMVNSAALSEILQHLFESIREQKGSLDFLRFVLLELLSAAGSYAAQNNLQLADVAGTAPDMEKLLEESATLEAIEQWWKDTFDQLLCRCSNHKKTGSSKIVQKAREFIDENYWNKDLDLEIISGNIFVNPSHLSSVFKKETGKAIVEYLTEVRMRHAKALIESQTENIYEVAEKVGYNNAFYFSKCFKKQFGVSPSKYSKRV